VTKQQRELPSARDANRLLKAPPTVREQLVEERPINTEHRSGRTHCPTRTSCDCLDGSRVMSFGERSEVAADIRERRLRQYPTRHRRKNAARLQQLPRQIKPVPSGIFREVAKYVGEL
jgi:hypothetical protein